MPIGCAIVKIADFPVAQVQFPHATIPDRKAGFVLREMQFATAEELAAARVSAVHKKDSTLEEVVPVPTAPTTFKI